MIAAAYNTHVVATVDVVIVAAVVTLKVLLLFLVCIAIVIIGTLQSVQ